MQWDRDPPTKPEAYSSRIEATCAAFRAYMTCEASRCARNHFTTRDQTIHAAIPRMTAANPLIWPAERSAAPAVDDAVAAGAVDEAALPVCVLVALTEASEDAEEAEEDALS
jgi:hypothetical protein